MKVKKIKSLDKLEIGNLYIVKIKSPNLFRIFEKNATYDYEDLRFVGFNKDGNPLFVDERVRKSLPYYNEPMFFKASNFESGLAYSTSIYEQRNVKKV